MSYRDPLETSGSLRGDSFPPGWSEPLAQLAAELERADRGLPFPCLALLRADADHDVEALETGLSALAARAGWRLASARFSRPARFPHGALSAILESVAGFVDLSASGLWKDCSALGLLAPAMALEAPAEARQLALRGAEGSLLLSRSLADFFARLGRESRTVILLRDLQRADREDLLMLRTLSGYVHHRNAEEAEERGPAAPIRIFIVATFLRPAIDAGERGDEGQAQTIREIGDEPYTVNIRAGLLSIEETADWLASRDPSRALDAERVRRIHEACGGRARRLEELWRRIAAAPGERVAPARDGRPAGDAAQPADAGARDVPGLPADLVDASHERVCALAQRDRRLLELMAVAPEASFPLDVMRRAGLRLLEREDSPRAQQGLPSSESASPEDAPARRSPEHAPAEVPSAGSSPEGRSADGPAGELERRIARLVDEGLLAIRREGAEQRIEWIHEGEARRIRGSLSQAEAEENHRLLCASYLEEVEASGGRRGLLEAVHHAGEGRMDDLYLAEAPRAAEQLIESRALAAAARRIEHWLQRAADVLAGGSKEARAAGARRREWTLRLAGLYRQLKQHRRAREAISSLLVEARSEADLLERSRLCRELGEIHREAGEIGSARSVIEKSLRLIERAARAPKPLEGEDERVRDARSSSLLALAELELLDGRFDRAREAAESLVDVPASSADERSIRSRAHLVRAETCRLTGDYELSRSDAQSALLDAREARQPLLACRALALIALACQGQGLCDEALAWLRQGLEAAEESGLVAECIRLHREIGNTHHDRGELEAALQEYRRCLDLSVQIGDQAGVAQAYSDFGVIHRLREATEKAASSFEAAIDICARINDQRGLAAGWTRLSAVLEEDGRYDEALDYAIRALQRRREIGTRAEVAFSYYRLGRIYQSRGDLERAMAYAERAVRIRARLGDRVSLAYSHLQLAELLLRQSRLYEAFHSAIEGWRTFQSVRNRIGAVRGREILARVYAELGRIEEAEALAAEARSDARECGQSTAEGNSCVLLFQLAMERGRIDEAQAHLREAEAALGRVKNRRKLAEIRLEACALEIERGRPDEAAEQLEAAYDDLEASGIRDLAATYFLLRSRLEESRSAAGGAPSGAGGEREVERYLERGLKEALTIGLRDPAWRIQFRIGLIALRRGETETARASWQEARRILEEISSELPQHFRRRFFHRPARAALLEALEKLESGAHLSPETGLTAPPGSPEPGSAGRAPPVSGEPSLHRILLRLHEMPDAPGDKECLARLLETIVDGSLGLVNAERGCVWVLDARAPSRRVKVSRDLSHAGLDPGEARRCRDVVEQVLRTGRSFEPGEDGVGWPSAAGADAARIACAICLPFARGEEILGALYLENRQRRDPFTPPEKRLLEDLCVHAALALSNARRLAAAAAKEREREKARRLAEASRSRQRSGGRRAPPRDPSSWSPGEPRAVDSPSTGPLESIVGESRAMREIFSLLERLRSTAIPVLIQGESGTGKELVARAIHRGSARRGGPFISENCSAVPESLMETEFFGHERGAFTGAVEERQGLFELAQGGTLFLDEVAGMSLDLQGKLLRALKTRELRRIGGKETIPIDARIISSANRDLGALVSEGLFREDLYYLLSGLRIELPPLRERREDIPLLVDHFLGEIARRDSAVRRQFSPAALRILVEREWPGNVRELRNAVERTVLVAGGDVIDEDDLYLESPRRPAAVEKRSRRSFRAAREAFEKEYVRGILEAAGGNVSKASQWSGLSRESLYRLLRKHRLPR